MPGDEGMRPEGGEQLSEPLVDPRAPWEELIEDPSAPRRLLAVLFTDIVGSTELATTLGDKRWRELLEQHDAAIRAQIARYGGREVDTAGDAFFATFELPVRAVDCALESMRAVRRLGLRIRAGVHMGECVVSDAKVRGVSVHIGARVAAKARGDELLVSSTVRDILAGAGLKFLDRGEQTLKGVEGRWRLYAVEPRERDNEADLPPLLELEIAKPPPRWWKRRRVVVAAVTALAVLLGAVAYVTLSGPGGLSSVPADSVALIDASSGDVTSFVRVNRRPVGVAAARDGVWVTNSIDRSVTRVRGTGQTNTIPVGAGPTAVATNDDTAFVANSDGGTVSRVNDVVNAVVGDPIQAGNGLSSVAFGKGRLWIAHAVDGTVWSVDPGNGEKKEIRVGPSLRGIAFAGDSVWATSEAAGTLTQISPDNGVIVRVIEVGEGPVAVTGSRDAVWVANHGDASATRIDVRTGRRSWTRPVGRGPRAVAFASGRLFVANEDSESVTMLEATTGEHLRTISLRNAPMGLAADGERVWVSVRGGVSQYRGGVLRMRFAVGTSALPGIASIDPNNAFDPTLFFSVTPVVYDGLLSFKKVSGPESGQLVPNLVEELRPPTDDGTTYTFKLRPGIRYSDGTVLGASDVRETFERIASNPDAYGAPFVSVIRGADGCTPERCDLSEGIVTDDRAGTVVFRLRNAYADFPYNLALPSLSIVPGKTPKTDAGLKPIVGTGPYRYASVNIEPDSGGTIVLERNRHFRSRDAAQPDGYADRIEITLGGDPRTAVSAVRGGAQDLTFDVVDPTVDITRLETEAAAQLRLVDMPWNVFIVMNSKVPPFNNVKARQALNFAIDRQALIQAREDSLAGDVSCQLLPKNTIGYVPYCPYTARPNPSGIWYGPDLAKARQLVTESGTRGQRVTVWTEAGASFSAQQRAARAPLIAAALNRIGYRTTVRVLPGEFFPQVNDPNSRHQVWIAGWISDYPGAANFVLPLTMCPETLQRVGAGTYFSANLGHFCSPSIDALAERALATQTSDPAAARDLWAQVDKAVTDAAVFAPWGNLRNAMLTSRRAGNVQAHPVYLTLLSQIWVVEEPKATPSS